VAAVEEDGEADAVEEGGDEHAMELWGRLDRIAGS
jgi:hypothetical protein